LKGVYPVDGTKHLYGITGTTLFMIRDENNDRTYKDLLKLKEVKSK